MAKGQVAMSPEEKKRRKDAKKATRRLNAGKTQLTEEQYARIQQQDAANTAETRCKVFDHVLRYYIPYMLHINTLEQEEPFFYKQVVDAINHGEAIVPGISWSHKENCAIWYNELNPYFTFDTRTNIQAKAAVCIVSRAMRSKTLHEIPALTSVFALACHERSTTPEIYCFRDTFLDAWNDAKDVFELPTRKQIGRFTRIAGELKAALPRESTAEGQAVSPSVATEASSMAKDDVEVAEDVEMRDNFEPNIDLLKYPAEYNLDEELDDKVDEAPLAHRRFLYSEWVDEHLDKMEEELEKLKRFSPEDTDLIAEFDKQIDLLVDGDKLLAALEKIRVLEKRTEDGGLTVYVLKMIAREKQLEEDEITIDHGMKQLTAGGTEDEGEEVTEGRGSN